MPTPLDYGGHTPAVRRSWFRRIGVWLGLLLVLVGALIGPALYRSSLGARDISPRAKCASNEHQIGLAILLYQQDHAQHYPPALADLLAEEQIGPEVFTCPSSNDERAVLPPLPAGRTQPTTREAAAAFAVPGHLSYVYFGHPDWTDQTVPADAIVVAEPLSNHGATGRTSSTETATSTGSRPPASPA